MTSVRACEDSSCRIATIEDWSGDSMSKLSDKEKLKALMESKKAVESMKIDVGAAAKAAVAKGKALEAETKKEAD